MHLYEQLPIEPEFWETDVEQVHDTVNAGLKDFRKMGSFSLPIDSVKVAIGGRRMSCPKRKE
jgi:hypothetical protein